jgi:putative SOS response-associated peptidase YedK
LGTEHSPEWRSTAANAVLSLIHDRMPVIVPPREYDRWLDPALLNTDSLEPLLTPFPPEDMLSFPVSSRVNVPTADDEGCVTPLP